MAKELLNIKDGLGDPQKVVVDVENVGGDDGYVPYHAISGSVAIENKSYEQINGGVTTTVIVPLQVTGSLAVASSNANPVIVTTLTSSVITRKLYTDNTAYSGKTGVQTILISVADTGAPNNLPYYNFTIPAVANRKQLLIYNNSKETAQDQSLYISIGATAVGDIVDDAPTTFTFALPTANLYSADAGTAHLAHNIFVLQGGVNSGVYINVTEMEKP